MIVHVRKLAFLCFMLILNHLPVFSQNDPYRAEIGLQAGLNIYSGDINSIANKDLIISNLQNMKSGIGGTFRYRFNQRLAMRLGYDFTSVKGNYTFRDASGTYSTKPDNQLHMMELRGEFNFFDLENNPYKRFSKTYSPFIFAGFGAVIMPGYKHPESRNYAYTLPFGAGLKVKFSQRWNFNMLLTNTLLMGDQLEGMAQYDNPLPKTEFNPMNHDMLSGISIGFSYDFWTRDCDCNENSFATGRKPASQKTQKVKKTGKKP